MAFARTAIIRSREPHPRDRDEAKEVRLGYYAHIAAEPMPSIAVIQDIDVPDYRVWRVLGRGADQCA